MRTYRTAAAIRWRRLTCRVWIGTLTVITPPTEQPMVKRWQGTPHQGGVRQFGTGPKGI